MIVKIIKLTTRVTPVLAVLLVFLQILVSNELTGLGQKVQDTDSQINKLTGENEALRQQVASASALATLTVLAHSQGFTETPNYIVIGPEEFALQPLR